MSEFFIIFYISTSYEAFGSASMNSGSSKFCKATLVGSRV